MLSAAGIDTRSTATIARLPCLAVTLFAAVLASGLYAAYAQDEPPPPPTADQPDGTRKEILGSLQDVQKQYGSNAVMLQGQLLGQAIRSGSIIEAAINIPGYEERGGKRFLAFALDTGIIYNERELRPAARRARIWTDIVEVSLRKFPKLTLPADGIGITLTYAHKAYTDAAELRASLADDRGQAETAAFYFLLADISELTAKRITPQQLLDR